MNVAERVIIEVNLAIIGIFVQICADLGCHCCTLRTSFSGVSHPSHTMKNKMKKHNNNEMVRVDVFFKRMKRQKPYNIYSFIEYIPMSDFGDDEIKNCEMLVKRLAIGKGTHQTGVFEIQTDMGIYSRIDGQEIRIHREDWSVSPRLVQFKSWKQLEEEELAAA